MFKDVLGSCSARDMSPHTQRSLQSEAENESESEVTQSCPTLCNPMAVAYQVPPSMGFSRQEYWSGLPFPSPMHESELLATPWTAAYEAPPSMGFSRQEYWSGLPWPSPTPNRVSAISRMRSPWNRRVGLLTCFEQGESFIHTSML